MTLASITKSPSYQFDSRVNQSTNIAYQCLGLVESFLGKLRNEINIESNSPNIRDNWPAQMENVVTMSTTPPSAPSLPSGSFDVPTAPTLSDITIQRFTMPTFSVPDPSIVIPATPDVQWPTDPGSAPSLDDVVVPNSPSYTLPAVPTLEDIALPTAPELETFYFQGTRPEINLDTPGNLFVYQDQPYTSEVRDALAAKFLHDIQNGGTGLGAEVEHAIWDRAKSRLTEDMQVEIDRITNLYAASGCSRPSGPMMAAIARQQQEYGRKLSDLDKDILVQQSELAQKNTQFALEQGLRYEQTQIDLYNKIMDRAFLTAKEVATSALAAFDAEVKKHNLQLDQYKADAAVYENLVKANLANLEKYKAMLEAAKIQGDLQTKQVDLYNAQLKGVMSVIEIYKSEMEGAKIKSEVQVQKLTAYRSSVEAYASRVNANVARFNAFSAQVAGEKAKADVYEAQVRAYESQVKAVASQADSEAAYAKALADANRSKVESYQADIQRYKADVDYAKSAQDSTVGLYRAQVEGFGQQIRAVDSHNDTQYKKYTSQVEKMFKHAQSVLEETKQELNRRIEKARLFAETSKAGATVYAQALASALSQVNASVRVSYDEGVSNSASETTSISTSV